MKSNNSIPKTTHQDWVKEQIKSEFESKPEFEVGYQKWMANYEVEVKIDHGQIKHHIVSDVVLADILEHERMSVRLEQMRADFADLVSEQEFILTQMKRNLYKNERFRIDEEKHELVITQLAGVFYKSPIDRLEERKGVVEICMHIGEGAEIDDQVIKSYVESLETNYQAFFSDLFEYVASAPEARKTVHEVCTNSKFANTLKDDEGAPNPLRYLASISIQVNRDNSPKNQGTGSIGFQFQKSA